MHLTGGPTDYLIVFFGGLLMSFSPCAYPLLPIAVAAIVGANGSGGRLAGLFLSLLYVFGMALSYSLLAVLAALSGKVFGTIQNSFWIQFGVANVFLFFGLAMLEAIHLPGWNLARDNHKKEGWLGVFLMGFASGFVVGPCTAPVLGALLVHVAARQNITFGVSLLMTFAFGLGFLLVVAGTFSGLLASLPRSGAWMRWVKRLAGLGLLGLAEYYFLRAGQLM